MLSRLKERWKTISLSILTFLSGLLETLNEFAPVFNGVIPAKYLGPILMLIGVSCIILRLTIK